MMGRYSLETYFFGMILTALGSAYPCLVGQPSAVEALAVDVDICVLSALWAYLVHFLYNQMRRRGSQEGAYSKTPSLRTHSNQSYPDANRGE